MSGPHLTAERAAQFAKIALGHVGREYPHKLDHVLCSDEDLAPPRDLHPVFFGSFDWHSCVHGYWLLARLYRLFPDGAAAAAIRTQLDQALTPQKLAAERAYLDRPYSGGFERPYGWAWALALGTELSLHADGSGRRWAAAYRPLAEAFADRLLRFLPKAVYPVRTGAHANTAFALILSLDHARTSGDAALAALIRDTALRWYGADQDCQAWEPDGDAFLSPALTEAALMADLLPGSAFAAWLDRFLPRLAQRAPQSLFHPVVPSDRSDGKIAHLDGLNLSRAWCCRRIAAPLDPTHPARAALLENAVLHLDAALHTVSGDYMGEHWLASFALLALLADPEAVY